MDKEKTATNIAGLTYIRPPVAGEEITVTAPNGPNMIGVYVRAGGDLIAYHQREERGDIDSDNRKRKSAERLGVAAVKHWREAGFAVTDHVLWT